jgi:hypothetical protein
MDIVETLQNNPIFQLSLSSKELFHSNFLAWLAEDKNTRGIFNQLMQVWLNDPIWEFKEEEMMVKREYKNFDFCICQKVRNYHIKKEEEDEIQEEKYIPGAIIFVLENKFKSLPYKEQLENYHKKVIYLNIQGLKEQEKTKNRGSNRLGNNWAKKNEELINFQNSKTKYVLLTLADNILDKTSKVNSDELVFTTTSTVAVGKTEFTNRAEWKIINYKQYSNILSQLNKKKKLWNNVENKCFYQKLINKYCMFIDIFSNHISSCLKKISNKKECTINNDICWNILTSHQEFYKIRCYDIWQKLVMYECAKYLVSLLDNKFTIDYNSNDKHIWEDKKNVIPQEKEKLYIGIGFFHGEAFLEVKFLMPNGTIFCLQQQGNNSLSVGLVVKGCNIPKSNKKDSEWNEEVIKTIGNKFPKGMDFQKKKYYSYQGEKCSFFYYHIQEEEVELQGIENKKTNEKYLSIKKTLHMMKDLMDKATETSN